jgi:hypothetical protein
MIGIVRREIAVKITAGMIKKKFEVNPEIKKRISETSIKILPRTINGFRCIRSESHPKNG